MAWRRQGDKPLSEPVLTHSTDTYVQHSGGGDELMQWAQNEMARILQTTFFNSIYLNKIIVLIMISLKLFPRV